MMQPSTLFSTFLQCTAMYFRNPGLAYSFYFCSEKSCHISETVTSITTNGTFSLRYVPRPPVPPKRLGPDKFPALPANRKPVSSPRDPFSSHYLLPPRTVIQSSFTPFFHFFFLPLLNFHLTKSRTTTHSTNCRLPPFTLPQVLRLLLLNMLAV